MPGAKGHTLNHYLTCLERARDTHSWAFVGCDSSPRPQYSVSFSSASNDRTPDSGARAQMQVTPWISLVILKQMLPTAF